jgi:hypothetical protein
MKSGGAKGIRPVDNEDNVHKSAASRAPDRAFAQAGSPDAPSGAAHPALAPQARPPHKGSPQGGFLGGSGRHGRSVQHITGWVLGSEIVLLGATLVTRNVQGRAARTNGLSDRGVEEPGEGGAPPPSRRSPTSCRPRTRPAARRCSASAAPATMPPRAAPTSLARICGARSATGSPTGPTFPIPKLLRARRHTGLGHDEARGSIRRAPSPSTKMTFAGLSNPQEARRRHAVPEPARRHLQIPPPPPPKRRRRDQRQRASPGCSADNSRRRQHQRRQHHRTGRRDHDAAARTSP